MDEIIKFLISTGIPVIYILIGMGIMYFVNKKLELKLDNLKADFQSKLDLNSLVLESLWKERYKNYGQFWEISSVLPKYPKAQITYHQLFETSSELKLWYFKGGGILMSDSTKKKYFYTQEGLLIVTDQGKNIPRTGISEAEYSKLQKLFSDVRTSMTNDLNSRQTFTFP